MKYAVRTTANSEQEILAIVEWLEERSPKGVLAWCDAWEAAIELLASNPLIASLAPENSDHDEEVRNWSFKTKLGNRYRMLLIVRDKTVFITNVRGAGQKQVAKDELELPDQ